MDIMEIIPGKRKGSSLFFYKGFKYLEDNQCTRVARCSSRKNYCRATVHFVTEIEMIQNFSELKEDKDFFIKGKHTRFPDPDANIWRAMKSVMIERAETTNEKLINIFDSVCSG